MRTTREGGGQWKVFSGGQEVHRLMSLKREQVDRVRVGGGQCPGGVHRTYQESVSGRPDGLAFGQTRWWTFIFKSI